MFFSRNATKTWTTGSCMSLSYNIYNYNTTEYSVLCCSLLHHYVDELLQQVVPISPIVLSVPSTSAFLSQHSPQASDQPNI